jgi:hypothetical protein
VGHFELEGLPLGATTADSRVEWIAALNQLAALNPAAVVTGHKDPTRGNPPSRR